MFDLIKIYPVCEWVGPPGQVGVVVSLLPLGLRLYRLCSVTVDSREEVVVWSLAVSPPGHRQSDMTLTVRYSTNPPS